MNIWKALVRRSEKLMCNTELTDRVFLTRMSGLASTKSLEKLLETEYKNSTIDIHYVADPKFGGYVGRIAIIFETPEDHCAFRLTHGHKYS